MTDAAAPTPNDRQEPSSEGEPPKLLSIVYSSVATDPFDDEALGALLAQSRASNARIDLTGMLLYRDGRFIQFLEGPERAVRTLVAKIATDRRHQRIRVLLEDHVADRQFPEWTMGFESAPLDGERDGFRRSFDDLETGDDSTIMGQAARDLTGWFRARARPSA